MPSGESENLSSEFDEGDLAYYTAGQYNKDADTAALLAHYGGVARELTPKPA